MISSLYVINLLSTDEKSFIARFYQKLSFLAAFDPQFCSSFFDKVCTFIPKTCQESLQLCESPLTIKELDAKKKKKKKNMAQKPWS